jgi:hypothetical protein
MCDWSGRHEDSCGMRRSSGDPQAQSAEEAPGPPAESEVPRDRQRPPVPAVIIQRSLP